jgi:hypothetical protein
MSVALGKTGFSGDVTFKVVNRNEQAPLSWKVKNTLRPAYINGWIGKQVATVATKFLPITAITSELEIRKLDYERGMWIDYGVVGRKVVTTMAAELICDGFQGVSAVMSDFRYHALGTESTAEAVGDTALASEFSTAYLNDGSRAEGTQTEQAASPQVYETVATNTVDAASGAVEHGILNQEGTGGSLLDRTVFTVINLGASDAIQSTYRLTVQAGG